MIDDKVTRQGPEIVVTGSCKGCAHVTDDRGVPLCGLRGEPKSRLDRISFSLRTDWRTPEWCPRFVEAKLAWAEQVIAERSGVLVIRRPRTMFRELARLVGKGPKEIPGVDGLWHVDRVAGDGDDLMVKLLRASGEGGDQDA